MECPRAYQPQLDESGRFWKGVQTACLQAFSQVHWDTSKSNWHFQACKFHIFQAVLRKAISEWEKNPQFIESMKRGLEADRPELYVFSTNADINYKLSLEETKFLRALHLQDFVTSVPWGVLHTQLVKEAIASFDPTTLQATVKGESLAIIAKNWRKQFQQVFHLRAKEEQPVTKEWTLAKLFPSLKADAEAVRTSDCKYPGAKRPLRLLSSLLCLNTARQHHIAISFAEHVVAALNGKAVDWPQQFYRELTREIGNLHTTHCTSRVKLSKTTIGPHVTLILRAERVMDIREEFEAGFRTPKALTITEQAPLPTRKKTKAVKGAGPQPKNPGPTTSNLGAANEPGIAEVPSAPVYSATPQGTTEGKQVPLTKNDKVGASEPNKPPKVLPPMVEQICQAHRRLENLLVSFTSKAPAKFVNQMNDEFFRIQRVATLSQPQELPCDKQLEVLLKAQEVQLQHLTTQLANAEELNEVNIETNFQLEEEAANLQQKWYHAQEEILSLKAQKGEALGKLKHLQERMEDKIQQLGVKDKEISHLNIRIIDMSGMLHRADTLAANQKATIRRLESQIALNQQDILDLESEPHTLQENSITSREKADHPRVGSISESGTGKEHPIMSKEKHNLTLGVTNKLLNELRRDLARTQQEKADLLQKIGMHNDTVGQDILPQAVVHPKTEVFWHILKHSQPLDSLMQYHRAYGGLHLLLSNIPLLTKGAHLDFSQMKGIWNHADAAARDTLAFMWGMGDLKTPLGVMETLSGSPAFYIKRYTLRCFVLLGQHHNMSQLPREPLPTLKSYTHSQFHAVRDFQRSKLHYFDQALNTLATEDTAICYEAVQHYQTLVSKHPSTTIHPTLTQLKDFVTKTLDEQHTTLSKRRFGTINSGTLMLRTKDQPSTTPESMGTCFL